MADNYLENKMESLRNSRTTKIVRNNPSLDTLLHRNRSIRGYDKSYIVKKEELLDIIKVNTLLPSAGNAQVLRFHPITKDTGAEKVLPLLKMGAALPELSLPFPGTEPEAFIIVCSKVGENRMVDIDLGISLLAMGLKCAEKGLGCLIVENYDKVKMKEALGLGLDPVAVLCVGKSAESIYLMPIGEEESHKYYRKDNVHYVPKVRLEDLVI